MKNYKLKNLDCAQCASKIENAVSELDYVRKVTVNFSTLSMSIDTEKIDEVKSVIKSIEPFIDVQEIEGPLLTVEPGYRFGYEIASLILNALLLIAGLVFQDQLRPVYHGFWVYAIFLSVYFLSGWKVMVKAFVSIRKGRIFDENLLMLVATAGAIAIEALVESAAVMFFFRLGEFFEELSLHRSRKSIHALLNINPDKAVRIQNGTVETVHPSVLAPGDQIRVQPGERIPVDGIVLTGESSIDSSAITGESLPVTVREGSEVLSGTVNMSGLIMVQVNRIYEESSASRIIQLVENAASAKSPTERFMTRFAAYYTPAILIMAILIAVIPPLFFQGQSWNSWIYRALVILVVSCPCALVISIPLCYFSALGRASRKGIMIKGSSILDTLTEIDTVVLDKTGTLTRGNFTVVRIAPEPGVAGSELLRHAVIAESHSSHPIAASIRRAFQNQSDPGQADRYQVFDGEGVMCTLGVDEILAGNQKLMNRFQIDVRVPDEPFTSVWIAVNRKLMGLIQIGDEVKKDSPAAVEEISGITRHPPVMLTGDNPETARHVSEKTGITEYYAHLLPIEKLEKIRQFQKSGRRVFFAGDGTNDAPVMAGADLSLSMGHSGTDAAIETSDIVILNDSLKSIPEVIRIAKKTRSIVLQNIIFAVSVKLIFIVLSFFGISTMWEAVFGDIGVAILAILNSMRSLR